MVLHEPHSTSHFPTPAVPAVPLPCRCRPASWKDPDGKVIRTRTKEQAIAQLKAFRQDIVDGKAEFATLAGRESDCSSASKGGDLGPFGRGQMQKPFEDATYANSSASRVDDRPTLRSASTARQR